MRSALVQTTDSILVFFITLAENARKAIQPELFDLLSQPREIFPVVQLPGKEKDIIPGAYAVSRLAALH